MISLQIEVKEKSLAQRFGKMPAAVIQGVTEGLNEFGIEADRAMIGALPHRSGAARKSIGHELRKLGLIPDLAMGAIIAPPPYMKQLEYGGVIRPKNGRFLTIPQDAARTGSGAFARFTARQVISDPEAFGYGGTFVNRGKTMILGDPPGDAPPVPLFALVTQVTQQATNGGRGWLREPIGDLIKRGAHREKIDAAVKRKLAALGGGAS